MRFLDTMSLHMATSGLTTLQRKLWNASERGKGTGDKRVIEFNARKGYHQQNSNGEHQREHQLDVSSTGKSYKILMNSLTFLAQILFEVTI